MYTTATTTNTISILVQLAYLPHLQIYRYTFSALKLLVRHQEERPACKKLSDVMLVICLKRGEIICILSSWYNCPTPSSLSSLKFPKVRLSSAGLHRFSWNKRQINECCCCWSTLHQGNQGPPRSWPRGILKDSCSSNFYRLEYVSCCLNNSIIPLDDSTTAYEFSHIYIQYMVCCASITRLFLNCNG